MTFPPIPANPLKIPTLNISKDHQAKHTQKQKEKKRIMMTFHLQDSLLASLLESVQIVPSPIPSKTILGIPSCNLRNSPTSLANLKPWMIVRQLSLHHPVSDVILLLQLPLLNKFLLTVFPSIFYTLDRHPLNPKSCVN